MEVNLEIQERIISTCSIIVSAMQQYDDSRDPLLADQICMQVEMLIQLLERSNVPEVQLALCRRALSVFQEICERESREAYTNVALCQQVYISGGRGRPKFVIPEELLEQLLDMHFTCQTIATLLGVSLRTVRRRMEEYGLSVRSCYSAISDEDLDQLVMQLKCNYPSSGYRVIDGILRSQGYRIQQQRIRSCMQRIDPNGAIIRWFDTIHRRKYHVQGPLSLWHVDGNHKLIR